MDEHIPRNSRFIFSKKVFTPPNAVALKTAFARFACSASSSERSSVAAVALCSAAFCSAALWSGCAQAVPQEFADLELREIATGTAGEGIYLATGNRDGSADGCGPGFFIEAGHPLLNQNLAIALSALYAKSRVQIRVDGCAGNGSMKVKGIGVVR